MTRIPSWQTALHDFFEANRETKFGYGSFDCCSFVTGAIEAMTGTDVYGPFRGKYSTRKEAYAALKEYAGTASVRAVTRKITEENGMKEVMPLTAQRGDVALIRRGDRDFSLGIIGMCGREIVALQSQGLFRVPLSMAVQCWRV